MVGDVVGSVALRRGPTGEVRRTPIVAAHCVAGHGRLLVEVDVAADGLGVDGVAGRRSAVKSWRTCMPEVPGESSGGCTAMVGDVGGTDALVRAPEGFEVRHTPIVADHCVAGHNGLLVDVAGGDDTRVLALVIVDAGPVSGRWNTMGGGIDVHGSGVSGCTAMVGNVDGTVAIRQEPKGEVRRTLIVADHCVAGRSGLLVCVAGDVDVRVLVLVIVDVGRVSGR